MKISFFQFLNEERRKAAGQGERLLRGQSLRTAGRRIHLRPKPPTTERVLGKRAKRAAHYLIRQRIAPNYRNLSTGQKMEIDDQIARSPEVKYHSDILYRKYSQKAAGIKKTK